MLGVGVILVMASVGEGSQIYEPRTGDWVGHEALSSESDVLFPPAHGTSSFNVRVTLQGSTFVDMHVESVI
jgi:hypothetical protein